MKRRLRTEAFTDETVPEEKSEQGEKAEGAEKAVSPRLATVSQPTNLQEFRCRQSPRP